MRKNEVIGFKKKIILFGKEYKRFFIRTEKFFLGNKVIDKIENAILNAKLQK